MAPTPYQENHYDPFGLNLVGIEQAGAPTAQFQYNGKEKQADLGLNWADYGARMYDAQLGRWNAVDPLAMKHNTVSLYSYVYNNPANMIDPDGRDAVFHITRDKNGDINSVNVTATIYIQGQGASAGRAMSLNQAASSFFKSRTVDGVKVSFGVTYAYNENKQKSELKPGENCTLP